MIKVYDLINTPGGKHYSPFAWRVLMVLKHKGLEFEQIGLTFTEITKKIPELTDGKWARVPVVEFENGQIIYDSNKIIDYIEEKYPDNTVYPNGKNMFTFIDEYLWQCLPLFQSIIMDILNMLEREDQIYFRKTREEHFKKTLEEFSADKHGNLEKSHQFLNPFRKVLKSSKFIEGDKISYSDYILFGHLKWVHLVSPNTFDELVTNHNDNSILKWYHQLQDLYDGYGLSHQ